MLYNNFFESSGIRQNNRLYFNNWNLVAGSKLLQRGLFHSLVRGVDCSGDYLNCETRNSSNISSVTRQIDLEIASNCFLYNSDFNYKSIYASFDFNHQFNLDASNTNAAYLIRSNRFVTLLPQPGVFRSVEESYNNNSGITNSIFQNAFVYHTSKLNYDAICIIELNLSLNSVIKNNYMNSGINLHGYLTGVELIDFESMNDYPVNRHSLSVVKNNYLISSVPNHNDLVNFDTSYQGNTKKSFSNSNYKNYFGTHLNFDINTNELGVEINKASTVIIPIKCNTDNNIIFAFSDIQTFDNMNSSQIIYSPINSYNKDNETSNLSKFSMEKTIFTNNNGISNVALLSASWQHFVFEKNTKITFSTSESRTFLKDSVQYMALLLKDDITEDERILDYNNVEIPTTNYLQLYKLNPFTINGTRYNYLLIKDKISNSFEIQDTNNFYKFAFQGIPVHINPSDPAKNNDIGIFVTGNS
ncbi:MAG: hypothetical protein ACK5YA_00355 [bacterium]